MERPAETSRPHRLNKFIWRCQEGRAWDSRLEQAHRPMPERTWSHWQPVAMQARAFSKFCFSWLSFLLKYRTHFRRGRMRQGSRMRPVLDKDNVISALAEG